jgi:DNA polymerase III subunit alpha
VGNGGRDGRRAQANTDKKRRSDALFATLDDLEGQVEMLVFNSAYAATAEKVEGDRVVLVRGRVDHKEPGETKLVAQEVNLFEPSPEEIERANAEATTRIGRRITLEVSPGAPDSFLEELREVVRSFPGDHEVWLRVGERRFVLGSGYRVSGSRACCADLASLPGAATLVL